MPGVPGLNVQQQPLPAHAHTDGASGGDLDKYARLDRASAQTFVGSLAVSGTVTASAATVTSVLTAPDLDSSPIVTTSNGFINQIGIETPSAGYIHRIADFGMESAGYLPVLVRVNLTAQSAAVSATPLGATAVSGLFLVGGVIEVTTADATAGSLQAKVTHTDSVGAETAGIGAPVVLIATGRTVLTPTPFYVASGTLDYSVAVTGAVNAARFNLRLFAMRV